MGTETTSATRTKAEAKPAVKPTPKKARRTLRLTLVLALLLVLVGLAGAEAVVLLRHAIRPPSADDTAQLVCTAYTSQNYDALLSRIDATPRAPAATDPFTGAAQQSLRVKLRTLDSGSGTVVSCTYKGLVAPALTQRQYSFVMRRGRVPAPITLLMTLVRQSDGGWLISRASDFTGLMA